MPRPSTGLLLAGGLATIVTFLIAWPVFLNPTQLIYGREIVGRQPDAYAVIQQFGGTDAWHATAQPLTDTFGWLLGRALPPVAAFNLITLLSFPLAAMTAYALGRYLTRSHGAGLVTGLAFAFAPAHLAHAAYHPYVTQMQWLPLYLLALVALVDRLSLPRIAGLLVACVGLLLSSVDVGLIGVVTTPVALLAFWAIRTDANRNIRPLLWPVLVLSLLACAAATLLWKIHPAVFASLSSSPAPFGEVAFYRARWWAYLVPSVDHPLLGALGTRVLSSEHINLQRTEEQLYLGYALLTLSAAALTVSGRGWFSDIRGRWVAAAASVGIAALIVSLGPTSGSCEPASMAPGCLLADVAPMFTAYARFGIIVQLMVAVTAGAGVLALVRWSPAGRHVATVLLVVAAFEYLPLPARAHDVLPTDAHRWIASVPSTGRTLDCYPGRRTEATIPWLMQRDVSFLDASIKTCGDPQIGMKLAAMGYSQLLVRRSPAASKLPAPLPVGLTPARSFEDSDIYTVETTPPRIVILPAAGFFGYEHQGDDWWQWMGPHGQWTVRNTTDAPLRVSLSVNLVPVGMPRRLTLTLDGVPAGTLSLGMQRQDYVAGPWTLAPGAHTLDFVADGEPLQPSDTDTSHDRRPLTVAFRNERWNDVP
jgi:hypothetical protein